MKIHIVGGFLGSGKTTLIIKIANYYISLGKKVTVLVNEVGEIGVDNKRISSEGLNSVMLDGGCICCSLTGSLQSTVRNIESEFHPDILLIEPTGLALPHKVQSMVRGLIIDEEILDIIGVCDAVRFRTLRKNKEDFLKAQLSHSDMLLVTKTDIADHDKIRETSSWLRDLCPGKPVYMVSGETGEGLPEVFSEFIRPS